MKNTEATRTITSKTYGTLTAEQALEILLNRVREPQMVSFGKAPKGGWTDADRITK